MTVRQAAGLLLLHLSVSPYFKEIKFLTNKNRKLKTKEAITIRIEICLLCTIEVHSLHYSGCTRIDC